MNVAHVVSPPRRRLLVLASLAAIGAVGWRIAAHRAPAPPVPPPITSTDHPAPAPVPAPPPPAHDRDRVPTHAYPIQPPPQVVEAVLRDDLGTRPSICGTLMDERVLRFHPLKPTSRRDLRVVVTCPDGRYLRRGHRYVLSLVPERQRPDGKNDARWRAVGIEDRSAPRRVDPDVISIYD